jgi:hypothetical protein
MLSGVDATARHAPLHSRGASAVLLALLLLGAGYTAHRAVVLRLDYYDGFAYLANARRLAGDETLAYLWVRPPVVPILQVPAVSLAMRGEPANLWYLVAPHLTSAALSILAAGALFFLFRRPFGTTLGLLGVALFVYSRLFVRYGAHVMTDLPVAGAAALTVAVYLRTRRDGSFLDYGLAGLGLGTAVLTKFSAALLLPSLLVAELVFALRLRRLERRLWTGLTLLFLTTLFFFVLAETAIFFRLGVEGGWNVFWLSLQKAAAAVDTGAESSGESWLDYGPMALVCFSAPVLVLAAGGLFLSLVHPEDRDPPFLAWLLVTGGGILFLVGKTEARYLLPAVPPLLYFVLRAVEAAWLWLRGRWPGFGGPVRAALSLGGLILAWCAVSGGVDQAVRDRDPIFLKDLEIKAARKFLDAKRGEGRLIWWGRWHNLYPAKPVLMPEDQYFNFFHFPPFAVEYLIGERLDRADISRKPGGLAEYLVSQRQTGDALLRVDRRVHSTGSLPAGPVSPLRVLSVGLDVLSLESGSPHRFSSGDGEVSCTLEARLGRLFLEPSRDLGIRKVFLWEAGHPTPRATGDHNLREGVETAIGPGGLQNLERLVLLRMAWRNVR